MFVFNFVFARTALYLYDFYVKEIQSIYDKMPFVVIGLINAYFITFFNTLGPAILSYIPELLPVDGVAFVNVIQIIFIPFVSLKSGN